MSCMLSFEKYHTDKKKTMAILYISLRVKTMLQVFMINYTFGKYLYLDSPFIT